LLPALPDVWAAGNVRGLCARGGFEVSIDWKGGQLDVAEIRSKGGQPCVVRYRDRMIERQIEAGATVRLDHNLRIA
jgi:alpha-L-fucosidase 2